MPHFEATERRTAEEWRVARPAIVEVARDVPDEVAVGLSYDGRPHVVLMATPADIEDLAVGFTVSERIAGVADITAVNVREHAEGIAVDIRLSAAAASARRGWRRRTMEGRSSCGLCGVERLSAAVRPLEPVPDGAIIDRTSIARALDSLGGAQALGIATRATHAAAFADASGRLLVVREDVGRHNALDKAIGAAAAAGLDPAACFGVVTSRCSYEMVEKAAAARLAVLVAISAPTALAIRKAEEAEMTLVALARADGHAVFTRPDRIADRALIPA